MTKKLAANLRFVGLHEDGEHLILSTPDGTEHRLEITEMIRAAVRRDRPGLELLKGESEGFLPPREIQAQIRSGLTAEEVAERNKIALSMVRRYEGPVLAERAFIATQAGNAKLVAEPGSPTLGEIVTDRLAHRGVDVSTLVWDAYRSEAHGWIIHASFTDDSTERTAQWTFDHHNNTLHALEAEARWLSETQITDAPIPRRLTAVPGAVYDFERDNAADSKPDAEAEEALAETQALLDQLDSVRGTAPAPAATEPAGETPVARLYSLSPLEAPAAHDALLDPPATELPQDPEPEHLPPPLVEQPPELAVPLEAHAKVLDEEPEGDLTTDVFGAPIAKVARKGKQRTRMPSWDEIMFGAKPE